MSTKPVDPGTVAPTGPNASKESGEKGRSLLAPLFFPDVVASVVPPSLSALCR